MLKGAAQLSPHLKIAPSVPLKARGAASRWKVLPSSWNILLTTLITLRWSCDNIWISEVLKISFSPKTNGKYTEATLQPPNSNGLLTLSVYFFIVVCKNESFCHRNHFRGLYVAAIRQVTKPLCWQQEVVIILLLLFTNNFPFSNFTSFFICPSLRKPRP